MSSPVGGFVAEGFEKVSNRFAEIISQAPDAGSSVSIWHKGRNVVNLWGGVADKESKAPWVEDTKAVIFSSTKGLMSLAIAQLYQDGKVSYDDLVVKYWPEYKGVGKDGTTLRDLVAHRAGIPFFEDDIQEHQVVDWDYMVSKIEQERAMWEPGSTYGYHAITHGWITGEIVRRVTGISPGRYLSQHISAPVNADTWLGLPAELENKVAVSYPHEDLSNFFVELKENDTHAGNFLIRSLTLGNAFSMNLVEKNKGFNAPEVHQAEIPGAGGISTAHGISKIWSAVVHEVDEK